MAKSPKTTKSNSKAVCDAPMRSTNEYASVSVRRIDNGYLISESREGPKGYTSRERFSPTKPKITMPVADAPKRR